MVDISNDLSSLKFLWEFVTYNRKKLYNIGRRCQHGFYQVFMLKIYKSLYKQKFIKKKNIHLESVDF